MDLHEAHVRAAKAKHCKTDSCMTKALGVLGKVRVLEEYVKNAQVVKR